MRNMILKTIKIYKANRKVLTEAFSKTVVSNYK